MKKKEETKKVHLAGLKGGQRVKEVSMEETPTPETVEEKREKQEKKQKAEKVRGKKYKEAKAKIDTTKLYTLPEAIKLIKDMAKTKFDQTLELHLIVKKTGMSVNVNLPYSGGKVKKVEVASDETIKKLESGKFDFDVLLATAEFMPKLVKFAKILGPKGLMPNPKNGTLIKSAEDAKKFSGNTKQIKTEKEAPLIHTSFGKLSQEDKELVANANAILEGVGVKQIIRAYMKSTMSPSVKIALG